MNDDQLKLLLEALQSKPQKSFIDEKIIIAAFAIIGFFANYSYNDIRNNSQLISEISSTQKTIINTQNNRKALIDRLDDFTRDPRFTEKNARDLISWEITPIKTKQEDFSVEFKARGTWIDHAEKRVTELERTMNTIKQDLIDIKGYLKNKFKM